MLSKSDFPLTVAMAEFARFGVEATYFVPTETGLTKAIIDAHEGLRRYLRDNGVHDFEFQGQGPDNKVKVVVDLIDVEQIERRQMSLYRPITKSGDPRIWIAGFGDYAQAGNLIALFRTRGGEIAVVNCSQPRIWESRGDTGSPLNVLLTGAARSSTAEGLLGLLRLIYAKGYVRSKRSGSTGVGFTLEELLGIKANASRSPDWNGIEIKSSRVAVRGVSRTRTTLFAKTPDWGRSPLKAGGEILAAYGYTDPRTGRQQLYCSLSNKPNSQGLFLRVNEAAGLVEVVASPNTPLAVWELSVLEAALREKHHETFWVKARQRLAEPGVEEFQYHQVVHTRGPLVANLGPLIAAGKVELDLTLSRKASGGTRDHGYLFKLWPRDVALLFPPPRTYDLSSENL